MPTSGSMQPLQPLAGHGASEPLTGSQTESKRPRPSSGIFVAPGPQRGRPALVLQ